MTSFYSPWATYIELISAPPQRMEECTHKHVNGVISRPAGCESNFAIDVSGANSSIADLQAQYAIAVNQSRLGCYPGLAATYP